MCMSQGLATRLVIAAIVSLSICWPGMPASASGVSQQQPAPPKDEPLGFATYRAKIEPIFLKPRGNGVRCYDCHSTIGTRLRLAALSAESSSWSEEQSRKNFEFVRQLVTPGNPSVSPLLLHPLATEAGGDAIHTGGKFWQSRSDPEWQMIAEWISRANATIGSSGANSNLSARDALDFQSFKTTIQPIFLKQRPGHARCYGCHILPNRVFHLATLSPGATDWSEEESRQNFESIQRLVVPGNPEASPFLLHPLAPEAGGDSFHSGGRQFPSYEDPDRITIANWVRSAKIATSSDVPSGSRARVYVTNSAGATIDVIDRLLNQAV